MRRYVICEFQVPGLHCWPNAPMDGEVAYLRDKHRHIFVVKAAFEVNGADREIEFISHQSKMEKYLLDTYGDHNGLCQFGAMSCEQIAQEIVERFSAASCTVLEDGVGGAVVVR